MSADCLTDAVEIGEAVRRGSRRAEDVLTVTLSQIARRDPELGCFTRVFAADALARAREIDAHVAAGDDPGPLAGVPFGVKDLFDVAGQTTTAGSAILAGAAPAKRDASVVARLRRAGAVLVGTLNMDEFAYGFVTENAHYGTTRNPHDPTRLAGGSSGGSAAAVAAGLVPIALGTDTNGSVRVPASLCGVFGLRPSFNLLSTEGVFPFVERLDTVGVFTRSLADLSAALTAMTGAATPAVPAAPRIARLGGWFAADASPDAREAVEAAAKALGVEECVELPLSEAARSAAFLLTADEGGRRHLDALRSQAMAFDPATRDRLIAGALAPPEAFKDAEAVAKRYVRQVLEGFACVDVLLSPTTPSVAPEQREGLIAIGGKMVSARANLGLYTQPLSLAGVPALSVPLSRPGRLPIGVQLVAERGGEALLIAVAQRLVDAGVVAADPPPISVWAA